VRSHAIRAASASSGSSPSVTAYRYYRIYVTANNGDSRFALGELELATSSGGSDITSPGMATSQDTSGAGDLPFAYAIDNVNSGPGDAWYVDAANTLPHWGWVDLSTPAAAVQLRMQCQYFATYGPARAPKDFVVQGSDDSMTWTDIQSFTGVTGWAIGTWRTFDLLTGSFT
jgi:hypothetical protein